MSSEVCKMMFTPKTQKHLLIISKCGFFIGVIAVLAVVGTVLRVLEVDDNRGIALFLASVVLIPGTCSVIGLLKYAFQIKKGFVLADGEVVNSAFKGLLKCFLFGLVGFLLLLFGPIVYFLFSVFFY